MLFIHWISNFLNISCSEIWTHRSELWRVFLLIPRIKVHFSIHSKFYLPHPNRWNVSLLESLRKQMEDLKEARNRLMRHAMTLSERRRQNRIPHGLFINKVSSFGSEFKKRWKQIQWLYCDRWLRCVTCQFITCKRNYQNPSRHQIIPFF